MSQETLTVGDRVRVNDEQRGGTVVSLTRNAPVKALVAFDDGTNYWVSPSILSLEEYAHGLDDAFIQPAGHLGAQTTASLAGKHLGTFSATDDYSADDMALQAIVEAMDDSGFWPNVWTVSDHGNVSLVPAEWLRDARAAVSHCGGDLEPQD
jgi:hypothetical protein